MVCISEGSDSESVHVYIILSRNVNTYTVYIGHAVSILSINLFSCKIIIIHNRVHDLI